jgi:ubiquitin-protein ligase
MIENIKKTSTPAIKEESKKDKKEEIIMKNYKISKEKQIDCIVPKIINNLELGKLIIYKNLNPIDHLKEQLAELIESSSTDYLIFQDKPDDLFHLKMSLKGPSNTPYEGGIFKIDLFIPQDYPKQPPLIYFITRIYHPNYDKENFRFNCPELSDWDPSKNLKFVFNSIQELLLFPDTNNPSDPTVAEEYLHDYLNFVLKATAMTKKYATLSTWQEEHSSHRKSITKNSINRSYVNNDITNNNAFSNSISSNNPFILEEKTHQHRMPNEGCCSRCSIQ